MTFEIDKFQGDPKIFITNDGAEMDFTGGQPIMDGGLENAVNISLLSEEGWFGNLLIDDPNQHVGSRVLEEFRKSITLTQLTSSGNAIDLALQWMLDTNIASDVTSIVRTKIRSCKWEGEINAFTNTNHTRINYSVYI
jgi:phage gp46-like protein